MEKITMGVMIGNRDFFSDELCKSSRERLLKVLTDSGIEPVILSEDEGVYGSVENRDDALKCANLFKTKREEVKGIIISLPNFGDEKSIAYTLRESGLHVPILVHAFPDQLDKLDYEHRRDSFCGKISVANNLRQFGYKYTLTELHTVAPEDDSFKKDLNKFIGVCRVVSKLKNSKIGLIGTRPADFNTVRFSEKILERNNISVEPVSLVQILNEIEQLDENNEVVKESLKEIKDYLPHDKVPETSLLKLASFLVVYRDWLKANQIDAVAVQCWDSIQQSLGINPCTIMSILSNQGLPSACESDVMGAVSMLALQEASGKPSGLVDWNNNFADDPDKTVIFHCGNFAKDMYSCTSGSCPEINYPPILASTLGKENTYGTIDGHLEDGKITFARIKTDDNEGQIKAYVVEGEITDDKIDTFGSWGVAKVEGLQELMQYICLNGFEHHVAINLSPAAGVLEEAFSTYLGWETYRK